MTSGFVEEYYIKALGSSVSFCLSARSSDTPFLNSLELRPLPDSLLAIKVLDDSKSALRGPFRYDVGAPPGIASIIRSSSTLTKSIHLVTLHVCETVSGTTFTATVIMYI
jgi:hypothetical protein